MDPKPLLSFISLLLANYFFKLNQPCDFLNTKYCLIYHPRPVWYHPRFFCEIPIFIKTSRSTAPYHLIPYRKQMKYYDINSHRNVIFRTSDAKYDFDLLHVSREHSSIKTATLLLKQRCAIDEIQ